MLSIHIQFDITIIKINGILNEMNDDEEDENMHIFSLNNICKKKNFHFLIIGVCVCDISLCSIG